MPNVVVIGMQWGDEGKGKIVDLLCPAFDLAVRYQGGHNAGHTVKFGDRHFALHLIPSGILREDTRCVLGHGMVVNPEALFTEIEYLRDLGVGVDGNLFLSDRTQLLLPIYADLDQAREAAAGKNKIGTTARGIGPAYEMKASRLGLRVYDLYGGDLEGRVEPLVRRIAAELEWLGSEVRVTTEDVLAQCADWAPRLEPYVCDTQTLLNAAVDDGKSLLLEGAQGTLLDLDQGTFPYVTSSSSSAGGACTGTGLPPKRIDRVLGVVKAYTSRVGEGPFVTELLDATGEHIQQRGNEYGTTTGRPRRCGWLDAVAVRYACRVNGADTIALTKLDVLDELDEISVCTAYRIDGEERTEFPASKAELDRVVPVLETVPGWKTNTVGTLTYDELPDAAKNYVELLERLVGTPIGIVSTGPKREETIVRKSPEMASILGDRSLA